MRKWLFCFQKSVALVLTQLLSSNGNSEDISRMKRDSVLPSTQNLQSSELWTQELGNGHGFHNRMMDRRRYSLFNVKNNDNSIDIDNSDNSNQLISKSSDINYLMQSKINTNNKVFL